jgi:hypothetical protein
VSFFSEATGIQRSAVIGLVVVLLAFSAVANIGGQLLLRRHRGRGRAGTDDDISDIEPEAVPA